MSSELKYQNEVRNEAFREPVDPQACVASYSKNLNKIFSMHLKNYFS